ncbi:hypothetical protein [Deinococcus terrestris]|nr:hypothetical protein [Deinococcus terrestris]
MFALLVLMVLLALVAYAAARQARLNLGPDSGAADSRRDRTRQRDGHPA